LHELYRVALDVARERYPEQWRILVPRLITVASWVGFDLDGRSDIGWATTFTTALRNQLTQLARYRAQCAAMRARAARHPALGHVVSLIDARFALAERDAAAACEAIAPGAGDLETLRRQAKAMHAGRSDRLVSAAPVVELIDAALALDPPDDLALDLCAMRAALTTHGLGLAHIHARINAAQLHNAVRKLVGMETGPDDPTRKWTYQETIEGLIENVEPATINFGSILDEETSARRVFMLIAQMLKYVDADQPVRFLIAECETAFTLLSALYFARLFGIEDKLDISPLFETRRALADGHQVVAEALRSPAFRAYVRRRGRLCIQTGYSDAGRYLGQTAAAAAIGRLRARIGDLLLDAGLGDVELLLFDTHGESIGRGGHPASLAERLRYVDDPGIRRRFLRDGIRQKQEVSFQGGDGYVYFLTGPTALAAVTRIVEHVLEPPDEGADPADTETAYVEQFFNAVGQFNARLMADQDFGTLLGVYGTNLLYPSGSRSTKRQHDTPGARVDLDQPSQLRAIPQNAILQQLGCLANTIGGLGQAVREDPERFQRLYRDSSRFRRLMNMVEYAFMFTDLDVLKAYLDLFDPGMWLARAARRGDDTRADELATVARVMEGEALNDRLGRVMRRLRADHRELALALREHRRRTREEGEQPIAVTAEDRDNMHMLHALRLGLIQKLMLLGVHLPQFSGRHEVTREDLIHRLIHLDVTWSVERLNEIFPMQEERVATRDFGEIATYRSDASQGYAQEHLTLFRPLAAIYELIRRVGSGVMHNVGALG
jgi:phosphoenolpyruvate carboxylase